jgi:hypothetical protein
MWVEDGYVDLDDVRGRTITVKVPAERRTWRIAGPSLPLAPTRFTFLIAMFVIVRVVIREAVGQMNKSLPFNIFV